MEQLLNYLPFIVLIVLIFISREGYRREIARLTPEEMQITHQILARGRVMQLLLTILSIVPVVLLTLKREMPPSQSLVILGISLIPLTLLIFSIFRIRSMLKKAGISSSYGNAYLRERLFMVLLICGIIIMEGWKNLVQVL